MFRNVVSEMWKAELAKLEAEGKLTDAGNGIRFAAVPSDSPRYPGFVVLRIWRGKAVKPVYDYLVKPHEVGERVVKFTASAKRSADFKVKQEAEKKAATAKMREEIVVGTILHGSWGYEQTNCELYEVVEKPTAGMVVIRELAQEIDEDSLGRCAAMSARVRPIPGKYIGEPMRKQIGPYGVKLNEHCTMRPTSSTATHYSSWYA